MQRLPLRTWLLATCLLGSAVEARAQFHPVRPGDPAIDFTLQDVAGASHTLSAYRGKAVLLALIGYS